MLSIHARSITTALGSGGPASSARSAAVASKFEPE
jgi:hypothetical protein